MAASLVAPALGANGQGVVLRVPFRLVDSVSGKRAAPTVSLERIDLVQRGGYPVTVSSTK